MVRKSIQSTVDRMSVKLLALAAARLEVGLELELSSVHGELWGQIKACEGADDGTTLTFVARLKALSEQLAVEDQASGTKKADRSERGESRTPAVNGSGDETVRRRGRPRKHNEQDITPLAGNEESSEK